MPKSINETASPKNQIKLTKRSVESLYALSFVIVSGIASAIDFRHWPMNDRLKAMACSDVISNKFVRCASTGSLASRTTIVPKSGSKKSFAVICTSFAQKEILASLGR